MFRVKCLKSHGGQRVTIRLHWPCSSTSNFCMGWSASWVINEGLVLATWLWECKLDYNWFSTLDSNVLYRVHIWLKLAYLHWILHLVVFDELCYTIYTLYDPKRCGMCLWNWDNYCKKGSPFICATRLTHANLLTSHTFPKISCHDRIHMCCFLLIFMYIN